MPRAVYPNGIGGGGGLGDLVSADPFETRAALDATSAEDGKLALLETPTSGEPRLFVRSGSAWVAAGERLWEVATTGAGVYDALLTAAGEAVYDGDLGIDGNGTVYVFVVDANRRAAIIPRALTGGIVVGETHTAELVAHWYKEDPSTADDVTDFTSGTASLTFDSGTGATTLQASASDSAAITLGSTPIGAGVVYMALVGATWAGNRSGTEGVVEFRYGASAPYDRIQVFAEVSGTYAFGAGAGGGASITGADPSTEHDIAFLWDGTNARAYYSNPEPAEDNAVPAPDGSGAGTPATTTSAFGAQIVVDDDASTPSLVCDGAYIITLTAI